jgi:formylglycine-generating enzyme required for sulfatase activity
MNVKTPGWAFEEALASFEAGAVSLDALLHLVDEEISAGASASVLFTLLERREAVDPLTVQVYDAVVRRIRMVAAAAQVHADAGRSPQEDLLAEAATIDLEDQGRIEVSPRVRRAPPRRDTVGTVLSNRFQLVELLGEGGMSRVFKAIDLDQAVLGNANHHVAIKVLTRPLDDPQAVFNCLQEEVERLHRVSHPNIARLLDCGRHGSALFITMEYVRGRSLFAVMLEQAVGAEHSLRATSAVAIIDKVARALQYAHEHSIVHGDLKPGNVLVTADGEVKVIDFAMQYPRTVEAEPALREAVASQTHTATPRYASPQLMSRQRAEPSDDVYALACLAYEFMTRHHPFEHAHGTRTPAPAPPRRPELSPEMYSAIVHGLQADRARRTPSARQFIDEFTASQEPRRWQMPVALAAATLLLIGVGWYFGRPTPPIPPHVVAPLQPVKPAVASEAVAAHPGSIIRDCPTCPAMMVIPPGKFVQGAAADAKRASDYERPAHAVAIAKPFALGTDDVTVGEFQAFIDASGRAMKGCEVYDGEWHHKGDADWKQPGFNQTPLHPVTCTSWNDAVAFADWMSTKSGHRYRLPTAAEWEYAARAGAAEVTPWGSNVASACSSANVADKSAARRYPGWTVFACDDGYAHTAPVGTYAANAFGLHDMLGNVLTWTQDCWYANYAGAPADGSARRKNNCSEYELRGGSWFSSPRYVRASYRNHFASDYRASSIGFRLARDLEP